MGIVNCQRVLEQAITQCAPFSNGVLDGVLINKADVVGYVASETPEKYNEFKSITLAQGKKGYKCVDFRKIPFAGSDYSHEDGSSVTKTQKTYSFTVYAQGPEADRLVDDLKNGRYMLVTRTEALNFEIIGKESALGCSDHSRQPSADSDNDGAWLITMKCSELTTGNYLVDTDYATTLSTYNALTT